MASHKFRIGQLVDFYPSPRSGVPASGREYKILRLLPHEGGSDLLYRIKTITEPYDRIAKESELVLGTSVFSA